MADIFTMMLEAFYKIFEWMSSIQYQGISVLHVCFLSLFFSLMWRFILGPLFGRDGGSLSIGVSDVVSKSSRIGKGTGKGTGKGIRRK